MIDGGRARELLALRVLGCTIYIWNPETTNACNLKTEKAALQAQSPETRASKPETLGTRPL